MKTKSKKTKRLNKNGTDKNKNKTNKNKINKNKTFRKEKTSKKINTSCKYKTKYIKDDYKDLKKEIILHFFEFLLSIKLFHWKTYNYGTHKATDEIYDKINKHMDRFIEVLIGKNERRINMRDTKSIKLNDIFDINEMKSHVEKFNKFLISLNNKKLDLDLQNIRDDIVTDLNQFLYLLTLH